MSRIEEKLNRLKDLTVVKYKNYDEPYIYDDETGEYFSCLDSMEDYYKDNNLVMPRYVYGVIFESISLDLDYILESACEEHHEDAMDSLDCVDELKIAIDKFNNDNTGNGSYYEDVSTIIELY